MSTYIRKDDPNSIVIVCEDGWLGHSAKLTYNPPGQIWPADFCLEFLLSPGTFFYRAKQIVKYMFGLGYSFWDDILIDVETAKAIHDFIDGRLKDRPNGT